MDAGLESAIRKYAIKNALDYGKAGEKQVLGRVLSSNPSAKSDMKALNESIATIVAQINKMDKADLEKEFAQYQGEFETLERKKAEESVPKFVLDGAVKGSFVTRYAPAPNGYMHIGHAKAALMASEFAKIYDGRMFLYFDDTNPEKDRQEYVDQMKKDLEWLGVSFSHEYYTSDSIDGIYGAVKQLILNDKAYVCECDSERISKGRYDSIECEHRQRSVKENEELFAGMLNHKMEEGKVIVRFKGDMKSQNTALRDPTLVRVKNDAHYRKGTQYSVWPTYDMSNPIMDSTHGATDIVRSKEFELRDELAATILDSLDMRKPRIHTEARLVIKNNVTHKRELNKLITEGILTGWDDPRLVTISALKRRGITPAAVRELVLRFGMSKTDGKVGIEMLLAENRKIIDPTSRRLYYTEDPVALKIEGFEAREVELKLHPTGDLGSREYKVDGNVYIAKKDADAAKKGGVIRLKNLADVEVTAAGDNISAKETEKAGNAIQWVPASDYVECSIMIPGNPVDDEGKLIADSMKLSKGYVESYAKTLKKGDIVQLERFGFCILDNPKPLQFIFISN
ncbi:MAG TPA: glutamate--tRNA ligase [Candidatus Baltobacteraceae bacterium]|nr:glutamate--tRNA ligase [Candidatus Baltobacteraceae bacterium]